MATYVTRLIKLERRLSSINKIEIMDF